MAGRRMTNALLLVMAAFLTLSPMVAAEPEPDGFTVQQILDRMAEVYAGCSSYRDSGVVTDLFTSPERGSWTVEKPFTTTFVRPDRFRFEYQEKRGGRMEPRHIVWRKGRETQTWRDFGSGAAIERAKSFDLAVAGATGVSGGSAHAIPALLLPEIGGRRLTDITEARRIDDAKIGDVECFRIEGSHGNAAITLWIEKDGFLVRRIDLQSMLPGGVRLEETTTYDPVLNGDVTETMLALNPPAKTDA